MKQHGKKTGENSKSFKTSANCQYKTPLLSFLKCFLLHKEICFKACQKDKFIVSSVVNQQPKGIDSYFLVAIKIQKVGRHNFSCLSLPTSHIMFPGWIPPHNLTTMEILPTHREVEVQVTIHLDTPGGKEGTWSSSLSLSSLSTSILSSLSTSIIVTKTVTTTTTTNTVPFLTTLLTFWK